MLSTQLKMVQENFNFEDSTDYIKGLEVILEGNTKFLNDLYIKTSYGEITIGLLDGLVEDMLNELDEEVIIECIMCKKKINWDTETVHLSKTFKVCEECDYILKQEHRRYDY